MTVDEQSKNIGLSEAYLVPEGEEALEYAESIINTVHEPLIVLNHDLRVVAASRSFYEVFKVKPEETIGELIYDLGNKQWDIPKLRELLETILPQHTYFDNYEVEHDFATIGRHTMLLNARQIKRVPEKERTVPAGTSGKEQIILLAIEDITERIKIETLLKNSEELYRRLFETANDGILLLEKTELKICRVNPAITATMGYSKDECLGKTMKDIGFPDDIGLVEKTFQTLNKDGILHYKEARVQTKRGNIIDADIYFVNKSTMVQCNIRDVTENKRKKEEKKLLESQIQQAQKMEAIGTLAGGIAHDFNNILSAIIGHTELLLYDIPKESPFQSNLDQIHFASMRAKALVKQILTFSRQNPSELRLMNMQHIVREVLNLIRSSIPATIEICQDICHDCGVINADPTQIHQIIMNLATNAYHAMEDTGGIITVSLKEIELHDSDIIEPAMKPGKYACLTVADTGTGIPEDVKNKIFDPFFTTKKQGKGTGMGLAVVHGIVKSLAGGIKVFSETGRGTEFHVYLPVAESYFQPQEIDVKKAVKGGRERIIFIDDEELIVTVTQEMLELLGYNVTSSTSSLEALEVFRANPDKFDMVITDMAMPHMSGDKLAIELLKIRPDIPILLCTGFSELMSEKKAISMGIKGFLMKPVSMIDFDNSIRGILNNCSRP
ncbi:MAG: PAS domain S-box protein [Desulfamplus sp.]|nr:PAS domain S-box protein [Desulfamplus sp.]